MQGPSLVSWLAIWQLPWLLILCRCGHCLPARDCQHPCGQQQQEREEGARQPHINTVSWRGAGWV